MKTEREVEDFSERALERYKDEDQADYYTACFEAGIPRTFWDKSSKDVRRNKKAFRGTVLNYVSRWKKARKYGYGLIFTGDNGTGKTFFQCFILCQMLKRGCSVYYTSLAQLDVDIKSGFGDNERSRRLDSLLDCDFMAIDEMGKEHVKDNSYLRSRLELLLKTRFDNGDPTLLATNLNDEELEQHYGSSIASMLRGRYAIVPLFCPDFREKVAEQMNERMGYK